MNACKCILFWLCVRVWCSLVATFCWGAALHWPHWPVPRKALVTGRVAAGQGIAAVSVLLCWTGWDQCDLELKGCGWARDGAEIRCSPWRTRGWSRWMSEENVARPCKKLLLEWVLWHDLWPPGEPSLEQFVKNCSPWEGPTLEKFGLSPSRDSLPAHGEDHGEAVCPAAHGGGWWCRLLMMDFRGKEQGGHSDQTKTLREEETGTGWTREQHCACEREWTGTELGPDGKEVRANCKKGKK